MKKTMMIPLTVSLFTLGLSACHAPPPGHHNGTTAHQAWCAKHPHQCHDRDNNPPGPRGGPGTNWENPPGPRGGPGTSPDRRRW